MAKINGSVGNREDYYDYYIDVTESEVNIVNNTSKVTAVVYIYTNSAQKLAHRDAAASHSITIDGTTYSFNTRCI